MAKKPRTSMLESPFRDAIMMAAQKIPGVRLYRRNTGKLPVGNRRISFGEVVGAADITGIAKIQLGSVYVGVRVEIEVKAPGKKLTPSQSVYRSVMLSFGAIHLVCVRNKSITVDQDADRFATLLAAIVRGLEAEIVRSVKESLPGK